MKQPSAVFCTLLAALAQATAHSATFDVLVYGSTPGGILAAVAAARHGARTALLGQRAHLGGVCAGGLGQSDVGACTEVIGGLALEFFTASAAEYNTPQPRAPWNLEPHIAQRVFLRMLNESGVVLLPPAQVVSVGVSAAAAAAAAVPSVLRNISVEGGATFAAAVFIDASYEGDLMARTPGVSYTWGRESAEQYGESAAGSQGPASGGQYGTPVFMDPFVGGGSGKAAKQLLPLLRPETPLAKGAADREIQAYNFRLCVTDNASLRVPFAAPPSYDPAHWELLRRFWTAWPNSTGAHKAAQAKVPSAILGAIPSSSGARKFDMNNCGYNPIHTDMTGGSWAYPQANYSERERIWQAHVDYTQGFLWFMSSDASVPAEVRRAYAEDWGYCGDEFAATGGFPPQLYVREARRLLGDVVFTQHDAESKTPRGNASVGLGCYNFDSHCEERYACTDPAVCTAYATPYVNTQCGTHASNPGTYQMPYTLLMPRRREVTNLLVPVCSSASHVGYATVRMEPQFMMLGHAAGVVAALSVKNGSAAVQDVDPAALAAALLADGQIIELPAAKPHFSCSTGGPGPRCLALAEGSAPSHSFDSPDCGGTCAALQPREWLALRSHFFPPPPPNASSVPPFLLRSKRSTVLKKSEVLSRDLPPQETQDVGVPGAVAAVTLSLALQPAAWDATYFLVTCARDNCTTTADARGRR